MEGREEVLGMKCGGGRSIKQAVAGESKEYEVVRSI